MALKYEVRAMFVVAICSKAADLGLNHQMTMRKWMLLNSSTSLGGTMSNYSLRLMCGPVGTTSVRYGQCGRDVGHSSCAENLAGDHLFPQVHCGGRICWPRLMVRSAEDTTMAVVNNVIKARTHITVLVDNMG